MKINSKTKLCMIFGETVEKSLSPLMHNSAYEALRIDDQYIFLASNISSSKLKEAMSAIKALNIKGVGLTIPHKEKALKYLDEIDRFAKKIGAVNTVLNEDGILKGYNTDWIGAVNALKQKTELDGKKVALIGGGGAARAIAYGLSVERSKVKIYNRTIEKAKALAKEFRCSYGFLEELEQIKDMDIIINASASGMNNFDETPVPKEFIKNNHLVFDIVYSPFETKLLKEAKEQGAKIIYGIEMLLYQGIAQFELFTGKKAPEDVMRKALIEGVI
jgi:shikimate dehydrogenase